MAQNQNRSSCDHPTSTVDITDLQICESDIYIDLLFPPFHSENKILLEGTLEKRGRWNPAWKPRYFVLEASGRLYYFLSEQDKKVTESARGVIPIDIHTSVKDGGTTDDGRYLIRIQIPGSRFSSGRTFILSSREKSGHSEWLSILSAIRAKVYYISRHAQ